MRDVDVDIAGSSNGAVWSEREQGARHYPLSADGLAKTGWPLAPTDESAEPRPVTPPTRVDSARQVHARTFDADIAHATGANPSHAPADWDSFETNAAAWPRFIAHNTAHSARPRQALTAGTNARIRAVTRPGWRGLAEPSHCNFSLHIDWLLVNHYAFAWDGQVSERIDRLRGAYYGITDARTGASYHPHQNGAIESTTDSLKRRMASLLHEVGLSSEQFWPFALAHALDIEKVLPRPAAPAPHATARATGEEDTPHLPPDFDKKAG
ncbi:hypothetical protein T492DRAFT_877758 [Pavlovales sp. CCMP2436]|nr:hypothetical protein T492DRAFT_877758 [Pavlovales sp. CCMP2436]